jgi:mono/diheme cytochrome c family protein
MHVRGVVRWIAASVIIFVVALTISAAPPADQVAGSQSGGANGWQLPPNAEEEKNPSPVTPAMLSSGKNLFEKKCERCHGPHGKGDGPDADPDHMEDMDLTNPARADRNAEGVVFYKVWNGRRKPKMPAFKDELTKDQAWAVVAYTQTLRKPTK